MYINASKILIEQRENLATKVSTWVEEKFPYRTNDFHKCQRDLRYVIYTVGASLKEKNEKHIDFLSNMFFKNRVLQLKSTDVEFAAYDFLLQEIEKLFVDAELGSYDYCKFLILRLKSNLTIKVTTSEILENRKAVKEYHNDAEISRTLIDSLIYKSWKVTPSKNQFMPYSIHVLGPNHQNYKNLIYQHCLSNENRNDQIKDEENDRYREEPPLYHNIKNCSYLLIFTLRLETEPNIAQQIRVIKGRKFDVLHESTLDNSAEAISLEVGMFSNTLSALCLENNIDVSYTLCFHRNLSYWKDIPFVKRKPLLLMTIGKGKTYRVDYLKNIDRLDLDLRPSYERIVNFIE